MQQTLLENEREVERWLGIKIMFIEFIPRKGKGRAKEIFLNVDFLGVCLFLVYVFYAMPSG